MDSTRYDFHDSSSQYLDSDALRGDLGDNSVKRIILTSIEQVRPTTLWAYNCIWRTLRREDGYEFRFGNLPMPAVLGWPWDVVGVGNFRKFLIVRESESIGVGVIALDKRNAVCWIDVGLLPAYRGQGFGSTASKLLIRKCFTDFSARRVEATALSTNAASIKMRDWTKLEAIIKARFLIDGREVDELIYKITRPEWELAEQRLYVHS